MLYGLHMLHFTGNKGRARGECDAAAGRGLKRENKRCQDTPDLGFSTTLGILTTRRCRIAFVLAVGRGKGIKESTFFYFGKYTIQLRHLSLSNWSKT